jgi:hypothetical protein
MAVQRTLCQCQAPTFNRRVGNVVGYPPLVETRRSRRRAGPKITARNPFRGRGSRQGEGTHIYAAPCLDVSAIRLPRVGDHQSRNDVCRHTDDWQRHEFHDALLDPDSFEKLPGRRQGEQARQFASQLRERKDP